MKKIDKALLYKAKKDYFTLLNKGYPQNSTLELVGNRFRLNSYERDILKRGIRKKSEIKSRKLKLIKSNIRLFKLSLKFSINNIIKDFKIYVDGWNVVITLDSFYKGKPIFISNDKFIRDITESGSSYKINDITYKIINNLLNIKLFTVPLRSLVYFYFEDNIAKSGEFIKTIKEKYNFTNLELTKNNDKILLTKNFVATSDSGIIDKVPFVIDLVKLYLKKYHKKYFLKILKL